MYLRHNRVQLPYPSKPRRFSWVRCSRSHIPGHAHGRTSNIGAVSRVPGICHAAEPLSSYQVYQTERGASCNTWALHFYFLNFTFAILQILEPCDEVYTKVTQGLLKMKTSTLSLMLTLIFFSLISSTNSSERMKKISQSSTARHSLRALRRARRRFTTGLLLNNLARKSLRKEPHKYEKTQAAQTLRLLPDDFDTSRRKRPNVILLLSDDQDVELGNTALQYSSCT